MRKAGRFNVDEMNYLRKNAPILTIPEMAERMNRQPESIEAWLKKHKIKHVEYYEEDRAHGAIKNQLQSESFWKDLKKQLTGPELDYFVAQYCEHFVQLEKLAPVEHTEKMQIVDLIRNGILLNRVLMAQKSSYDQYSKLLKKIELLDPRQDAAELTNLRKVVQGLEHNFSNYSRETKALQEQIERGRIAIMGTREQRSRDLKALTKDFEKLVKSLQDARFRKEEGAEINVFRAAMEVERKRLSQWHEFVNEEDIPLLTPELVDRLRKRD